MAMMISKFHKIIQSKVVWGVFAALISIAFVGVSVPGSKSRRTAKQEQAAAQVAGRMFGETVSRIEFARAYQSVKLNYTLQYGQFRITKDIDAVLSKTAWQRLAMLEKARQLGMTASPEQTILLIRSQPVFRNPQTGQFDQRAYEAALPQIRALTGFMPKDVENHYAEEVLLQKIVRIPIQGALVTDAEVKRAFHLYTDKLTVEYAAVPRGLAETPDVTEEEARHYYELNRDEFRLPEKALVHYVQFPVADHLDGIEISDERVAAFYEQYKQRFLIPPAEGDPADAPPEYQPLEEVKDSIAEQLQEMEARAAAVDLADELVAELSDETMTFEKAAEKLGLKIVSNTPAFAQTDPVKGVDPTAPFQRAAFALQKDETHYYSDPVLGKEYVYVISLVKKLDSFVPSFEASRDSAMESARIAAIERAYVEKAEALHKEVSSAIKSGTAFADAVGKYNLEIRTTEPFDITSGLEDEFGQQIIGAAVLCQQGTLTDLISTPNEYLIAYVAEKVPGDEVAALPGMRNELAQNLSNEKSVQLVAAWQEALLKEAEFEDLLPRSDDES